MDNMKYSLKSVIRMQVSTHPKCALQFINLAMKKNTERVQYGYERQVAFDLMFPAACGHFQGALVRSHLHVSEGNSPYSSHLGESWQDKHSWCQYANNIIMS